MTTGKHTMATPLTNVIAHTTNHFPPELEATLREIVGCASHLTVLSCTNLSGSRTRRIQLRGADAIHSVIVKRLRPQVAQRNDLVVRRWLPAVGLGKTHPALLGVAAERAGRRVWHVYEDLGDCALSSTQWAKEARFHRADSQESATDIAPEKIEAAVKLIAEIHIRFAQHPLLGECRLLGGDLGFSFYSSAIKDAIRCLETLLQCSSLAADQMALVKRLLSQMYDLAAQSQRAADYQRFSGPETLLHGDLWPINVMVRPEEQNLRAWLIDWDHAGVGPVSYDLSNFIAHFPLRQRDTILRMYLRLLSERGWTFPPDTDWNSLFEAAEWSRLATEVFWAGNAALEERADWAFDDLALVESWIQSQQPILRSSSPQEPTTR